MMKNIAFLVLLLLGGACQASETLATVGNDKITVDDLHNFAKKSMNLRGYLSTPNGPEKLLTVLIEQKLLVWEGEAQQIKRPDDAVRNDLLYSRIVRGKLLEACEQPGEAQLKMFYQDFPELFSTPYYVRARRISLKAKTVKDIKNAEDKLLKIRDELADNVIDFPTAVAKYSQDELSKSKAGDVGYIAIQDDENSVYDQFVSAEIGQYIGPVVEHSGLVNLYQIMARREPILDSYDAVQNIITEEYLKHCNKQRYRALINELKKKWPVNLLINDVSSALQQQ
ncbi:MAG: peptidylprolyl isomerase [Gammaproteobacteria bacterium]